MWVGGVIALILLLALAGCARTPRNAKATQPAAQATASDGAAAPAAAATPAPSPAASLLKSPAAGAPSGPAAPALTDSKRTVAVAQEQPGVPAAAAARQNADVTSLLALGRDSRTLPEDFTIGALGDARAGDAEDQQAMTAAGSFLSRLLGGTVDTTMLDSGVAGRISDMLEFAVKRGDVPLEYRIGTPKKHDNGEVTASVRLFSQTGTCEGEIALARTGGHWLVTDLQISMDDLQVKREKPKERFFPSSYRWMLEE
jgi:hypothetical protein